jgi:hypothetical protein
MGGQLARVTLCILAFILLLLDIMLIARVVDISIRGKMNTMRNLESKSCTTG